MADSTYRYFGSLAGLEGFCVQDGGRQCTMRNFFQFQILFQVVNLIQVQSPASW